MSGSSRTRWRHSRAREKTQFGGVRAPMSVPEDLVVFKAIAGRPKDIDDAEALLVLHPHINLVRAERDAIRRPTPLRGFAKRSNLLRRKPLRFPPALCLPRPCRLGDLPDVIF